MNSKHFFSLLVITVLLFNCSAGGDDPSSPDPNPNPNPNPTSVTYNGKIKGIVSNNCLSCHGNPTANGAPMSLTTYALVKSAVETRGLLVRINSTTSPMPQGGLMSQANRDAFQQWKDQGFLEN
ncbi:hypothetical protein V8G69_03975 [Gaetbulibacter sp. M235]|uniref:hypothetical protein n=1 Tax=Gaetbulibacter sp. M235 TaxID=3126510 RepID=UPI00374F8D25